MNSFKELLKTKKYWVKLSHGIEYYPRWINSNKHSLEIINPNSEIESDTISKIYPLKNSRFNLDKVDTSYDWKEISVDFYAVFDDDAQHSVYNLSDEPFEYSEIIENAFNQYYMQFTASEIFSYQKDEIVSLYDSLPYKVLVINTNIVNYSLMNEWCDATKESIILSLTSDFNKDYNNKRNKNKNIKDHDFEIITEYCFEDERLYNDFVDSFHGNVYWKDKTKKDISSININMLKKFCIENNIRLLNLLQEDDMDILWIDDKYHYINNLSNIPDVIHSDIDTAHCNQNTLKNITKDSLTIKGNMVINDVNKLKLNINKLTVEDTISLAYCSIDTLPKEIITEYMYLSNVRIPPLKRIIAKEVSLSDIDRLEVYYDIFCEKLNIFECWDRTRDIDLSKINVSSILSIYNMKTNIVFPTVEHLQFFDLSNIQFNNYKLYLDTDISIDTVHIQGRINYEIFDRITINKSLKLCYTAHQELPENYRIKFSHVIDK